MEIEQFKPIHPGEFIKRVYMEPFKIGSNELSRRLKVSSGAVSRLLNAKMDISPAMALKLSQVLGRSPESWLLMQGNYNLWKERQQLDLTLYEPIDFAQLQAG